MPTRLNQPAALAPTRIVEPKRHSSDKSFSATKAQIRQRISQLSINKNKVHNESQRRNTGEHQEKEEEEFHYLHVNAVMPSEAYVWEKNVARKPSRSFDSKDAHSKSMADDSKLTSALLRAESDSFIAFHFNQPFYILLS